MTTMQGCPCNEENYQIANPLRRIWEFIKRTAIRYRQWRQMKYAHHQLLTMEDRMLKDIGLSRADAVRVSNEHTFWKFMFQPESEAVKDRPRRSN